MNEFIRATCLILAIGFLLFAVVAVVGMGEGGFLHTALEETLRNWVEAVQN